MALVRTLRRLTQNPNPRSFLAIDAISPHPLFRSPLPILAAAACGRSLLSPLYGGGGPLFLSSPPWMLSQSATPLHFRGGWTLSPRDLLRARSFQVGLGVVDGAIWRPPPPPPSTCKSNEEVPRAGGAAAAGDFFNLPNLVSLGRMASGPVIGWMIMNEWYLPAFGALTIAGISDWLDGYLARKLNINSVVGSYLDPLADKVLISCVAVAMVERDLLHPALVGAVVFRDVVLVAGAFYVRASALRWEWSSLSDFFDLSAHQTEKIEPLFISKVNTVFQLLLVAAALLQPDLGSKDTQQYITYLSWLVASTTAASSVAYGARYLRIRPRV